MFGYIKTCKPELKMREYEAYKAVYCSLCHQLRKDYGPLARFTLNYDYTFFAMLRMAALDVPVNLTKGRCPYNPFVKCHRVCCGQEELSYAAAAAMIMFYYKLKDTLQDEGFLKRLAARLVQPFAARWHKKAAGRFPEAETAIAGFCAQQQALETSEESGLDRFAHPTAECLSQLLSWHCRDEATGRILSLMGYNMGKWVYLMDALDDYDDDGKRGRFNAFERRLGNVAPEVLNAFAQRQLNCCIDELCLAFELLPKRNFNTILANILYLGLKQVQTEIVRKVHPNE